MVMTQRLACGTPGNPLGVPRACIFGERQEAGHNTPQCRPSGKKDWAIPGVHSRRVGLHTVPESRQLPVSGGVLGGGGLNAKN